MRLEDYTADAICRCMSLPGFVEQQWLQAENPILRVVLTPSFDPELCVTFERKADSAHLSVVTLLEQFWSQRSQVFLPRECEEVSLPRTTFDEIEALFVSAHANFDLKRRFTCCDGMGSESCLVSRENTQQLQAHVSEQQTTGKFIARLIDLAWNSCAQPQVRNSLAHAAAYLDIKYPLQDVPPQPPVARLAVLGAPEDRRDYFEMLRHAKTGVAPKEQQQTSPGQRPGLTNQNDDKP